MPRFNCNCPRCKKAKLRPMSYRVNDTGFKSLTGCFYCPECDTIFRSELKEVTVHDKPI